MSRSHISAIPFFSYGFRAFFFSGAAWALVAMLVWILWITGAGGFSIPYAGIAWHAHELIIGYGTAVLAGFLLTAIPNWTGRPPIQGYTLAWLWLAWVLGRVALLLADRIGYLGAALLDNLFLLSLVPLITREIVAGNNLRNLRVVVIVALVMLANIGFHVEFLTTGYPDYSLRAALALFVVLISVIGGRIIPAFTRNWLVQQGQSQRLPVPFNRFDAATLIVSVISLALWTVLPVSGLTGMALLVAGILQLGRLARWAGIRTTAEPLVLILHVGYLFVGLGFVLVGMSSFGLIFQQAALHAWSTGAIGIMTLAVMTRASRGHAGFPLTAPVGTRVIYLLAVLAVLLRLSLLLRPGSEVLQAGAAIAWCAAFVLFIACYGSMLLRSKGRAVE